MTASAATHRGGPGLVVGLAAAIVVMVGVAGLDRSRPYRAKPAT